MLEGARVRLDEPRFWPVATDGQALPFRDASFDRVICQLGLQFFTVPARGLAEFRRVLRSGGSVAVCVISTPDKAPMWGILADAVSRFLQGPRNVLYLSFSLGDPARLEGLLAGAGFRDIRVVHETQDAVTESFRRVLGADRGWDWLDRQSYLTLSAADRRAVRDEVRARGTPGSFTGASTRQRRRSPGRPTDGTRGTPRYLGRPSGRPGLGEWPVAVQGADDSSSVRPEATRLSRRRPGHQGPEDGRRRTGRRRGRRVTRRIAEEVQAPGSARFEPGRGVHLAGRRDVNP